MILLYGKQYESSSIFFRIKLITNFFTLIAYAPLIINTGNTKYYSNVHMIGAIVLIAFEYISIITLKSEYLLIAISVLCQIVRICFMLRFISVFFNKKVSELFPIELIGKIVIPSIIIFVIFKFLLNILNFSSSLSLILGAFFYFLLFLITSKFFKLDYLSIIRPVILKFYK